MPISGQLHKNNRISSMSTSDGWPAKRMSGDYLVYVFPYGARALMAERAKVQKVLDLGAGMSNGFCLGGTIDNVVFKLPLSWQEGFVRNDAERITLIDRLRTHHNFNWKRDVFARPHINYSDAGVLRTEKHYATLINNLIEMQALTEELKPETLALIASCPSAYEMQQAMLNARA
jgi:hypothetical protein